MSSDQKSQTFMDPSFHSLDHDAQTALVYRYYTRLRSGKCIWDCCGSQSHTHTGERAHDCSIIRNRGKKIHPDSYECVADQICNDRHDVPRRYHDDVKQLTESVFLELKRINDSLDEIKRMIMSKE